MFDVAPSVAQRQRRQSSAGLSRLIVTRRERVAIGEPVAAGKARGRNDHRIRSAVDRVNASAADEIVVACIAVQEVDAEAAVNRVVIVAAGKTRARIVVVLTAVDVVGTGAAIAVVMIVVAVDACRGQRRRSVVSLP